jgi:hypothetical protein
MFYEWIIQSIANSVDAWNIYYVSLHFFIENPRKFSSIEKIYSEIGNQCIQLLLNFIIHSSNKNFNNKTNNSITNSGTSNNSNSNNSNSSNSNSNSNNNNNNMIINFMNEKFIKFSNFNEIFSNVYDLPKNESNILILKTFYKITNFYFYIENFEKSFKFLELIQNICKDINDNDNDVYMNDNSDNSDNDGGDNNNNLNKNNLNENDRERIKKIKKDTNILQEACQSILSTQKMKKPAYK